MTTKQSNTKLKMIRVMFMTFTLVILTSCATSTGNTLGSTNMAGKVSAEKLLAVDCLLPPQVRKLGTQATYLMARQPIKTAALDCEIRGGEYAAYDRANYSTALKVWLDKAKEGDAEAQTYVGEIYEKGLGLTPDYGLAHEWYTRAAASGHTRAKINLGNIYEQGLGVPVDKVTALNWYRQASGFGDGIDYVSSLNVRAEDQAQEIVAERAVYYEEQLAGQKALIVDLRNSLSTAQVSLSQKTAQLDQSSGELARIRTELESQQSRGMNTSELQRSLEEQRSRVEEAQQEVDALREEVDRQQASLPKPVIEIISPQVLATRGTTPELTLRSGGREPILKGRVTALAGLKRATMNGRALSPNQDGIFQARLPIAQEMTRVNIEAEDVRGQTSQLSFIVLPPAEDIEAERYKVVTRAANDINFGRYYALVIGNDDYQDYPKLQTPVNDAKAVANILRKKYGFDTSVVTNASRYTILSAINDIKNQVTENDNLLIYYAGHGQIDERTNQGYWLPVDAEQASSANWIPNTVISDLINTISAKHILVVADSCYSGSMSNSSIPRLQSRLNDDHIEKWLKVMNKTPSRTVLTSGGVEPVLDNIDGEHSVFARAFLNELEKSEGVIDAYRVYLNVFNEVKSRAASVGFTQEPSYAPIKHTGHSGGEFILVGG